MSEYVSRSAQKRRFKDEEGAAEELALLTDRDLKLLPAGPEVKEEIVRCRSLKGGARKRQVKYLAKVMRDAGMEGILDFLTVRKGSQIKANSLQREAERLRDVIINEAIEEYQDTLRSGGHWEPDWQGEEIEAAVRRYPLDQGDLRRTVHHFVKTRMPNSYRETFRILKAALEKEEVLRKTSESQGT
jgi:ribosome-associated protein